MRAIISDGNFAMHRAWSAVGIKSSVPTKKVPLQILDWFCSQALELRCDGGALAIDGTENFRYKVYGNYKSGRSSGGGDGPQNLIKDGPFAGQTSHDAVYASLLPTKLLFRSLGIRVIHLKMFEADDVMVSAAWRLSHNKPHNHTILSTNDKDMVQAITDNVSIYHAEMLNRPKKILTPKDIGKGKWGLTPKQFLDFQILRGDAVDSIPPIPGCDNSTALKIIREHGSLAAFFKTPIGKKWYFARATELHRNKELVMMSKKAFPYTERDISFNTLTGEAPCKSFTELKSRQSRRTLF